MKAVSLISIGSTRHIDFIRNRLDDEFKLLQAEGVQVNLMEKASGDYTFLGCDFESQKTSSSSNYSSVFKHYVAKVISEVVIGKWEENLVRGMVKNKYHYFTENERKNILSRALDLLKQNDNIQRKNKILLKTVDYLENHDDLIVDGFITFRLKEYLSDLEDVVDQAVEDYLMEKEYSEFISLLRYFVEIQDPRVEKVHVLLNDGNQNAISNEYLEGYVIDLSDGEINYEDLLISALITIAPRKIILHATKYYQTKNTIATIQNVFGDRVSLCQGCPKCNNLIFER